MLRKIYKKVRKILINRYNVDNIVIKGEKFNGESNEVGSELSRRDTNQY